MEACRGGEEEREEEEVGHPERRVVVLAGEAEGEGELAGWRSAPAAIDRYAYFRTEGPPGLANLSIPAALPNADESTLRDSAGANVQVDGAPASRPVLKSELNGLAPYVEQTLPPTVPAPGERPPLPRPIYRAYDAAVAFNENYVELLYRARGRSLALYLYDNNNRPVGDAAGGLWTVYALDRSWCSPEFPKLRSEGFNPLAVDVKSGEGPGVNGGFQGRVKSPMNKGRAYGIPGVGLAGDWPGAWTQTYAQVDTEAGPHGFDENYFVQQVAGLTQLAGALMSVKPLVIDLGWGELKTAIAGLRDASFTTPRDAAAHRDALLKMYVEAFRRVEAGALAPARIACTSK